MKTKIVMALLAGSALLAACKGSGSASRTDSAKIQDSIAHADSAAGIRLVKTAGMRIKVKNVQAVAEKISSLTTEAGGMVTHHELKLNIIGKDSMAIGNDSIKKVTIYNNTADITLKIPAKWVEIFMDSLNHMGTFVDNRELTVEDRTLDRLSQKLKSENREESVKLRTDHLKLTQKSADSILGLKDDAVDRKISNMRTDDAAAFTVITLSLYQNNTVSKEIVPSTNLADYKSPLGTRAGLAFSDGWYYFSALLVGLLNMWPFLLLAGAGWAGYIWYKRKKKATDEPAA